VYYLDGESILEVALCFFGSLTPRIREAVLRSSLVAGTLMLSSKYVEVHQEWREANHVVGAFEQVNKLRTINLNSWKKKTSARMAEKYNKYDFNKQVFNME
ncbi:hypothetical protein Tco_0285527, partial [Tanacetum coccineum]